MPNERPQHEKVRFHRREIKSLDAYPSAGEAAPLTTSRPPWGRYLRIALFSILGVLLLGTVAIHAISTSGIGKERLRLLAQQAITRALGEEITASIDGLSLSFDSSRFLALNLHDVAVVSPRSQALLMSASSMKFGLNFGALLAGRLELGSARFETAELHASALPDRDGPHPVAHLLDDRGLLDPQRTMRALFASLHDLLDLVQRNGMKVRLADIDLHLGEPGERDPVEIVSATLRTPKPGSIEFEADVETGWRAVHVTGRAMRGDGGLIDEIAITATSTTPDDDPLYVAAIEEGSSVGSFDVTLTGREIEEGKGNLLLYGDVRDIVLDFRDGDRLPLDLELQASVLPGYEKVEVENARVTSGASVIELNGAVGPAPEEAGAEPEYRFEFVSNGSTLAQSDVPGDPIPFVSRVAGRFAAGLDVLDVDEIALRTRSGEVSGHARVTREEGLSPGVMLALDASDIPVDEAVRLWPWFSARGARAWVIENMTGGHVTTGRIDLDVPPGRIGNGVPFGPEEISGRFMLEEGAFAIAGTIPPMHHADGTIAFAGRDVDIGLASGRVTMEGYGEVLASAGTMTIRPERNRPLIADLDISIEGPAAAVLALAEQEPIDVDDHLDIAAHEVSGQVSGSVSTQVPLQKGIPFDGLSWRVALDYADLALARPFEGQQVTEARGTIVVDPQKAVIDADAMLNGAPAELALVEPLAAEVERSRNISVTLNDAARNAIAPGLDPIISGTAAVRLEEMAEEGRMISADLRSSTVSLPWIGWSKGAGVPAEASFAMAFTGDTTRLSDFSLKGETFGMVGDIALDDGELQRARFDNVRLNRGDDFSVDLSRQGGGYAIRIRGKSVDVRSVIKLMSADSGKAAANVEGTPITLDLEVDAMAGFHGEVFRGVTMSYAGTGTVVDRLDFSAVTSSGRPVTFTDGRRDGQRSIRMQSADAGAVLRFLDIYERMEGGQISLSLAGVGGGPLRGQIDARDFVLVNEPRLGSIVSSPPTGRGQSLHQAMRGELDASRVSFSRGFTALEKGTGYLTLDNGILRGPLVGASFQGTLYDPAGNMSMTGTFMPAYGLNRIFGEIPIIGQILGNGNERGLIGITFKLSGDAGDPQLQVNPLSAIAPGIFRSVFEFR